MCTCTCLLTRLWRHKCVNLIFLIKPFSTWPKSQRKHLNMRTKQAFKVKEKAFFIVLKGLSNAKNCLRPEREPLIFCVFNLACLLASFTLTKTFSIFSAYYNVNKQTSSIIYDFDKNFQWLRNIIFIAGVSSNSIFSFQTGHFDVHVCVLRGNVFV